MNGVRLRVGQPVPVVVGDFAQRGDRVRQRRLTRTRRWEVEDLVDHPLLLGADRALEGLPAAVERAPLGVELGDDLALKETAVSLANPPICLAAMTAGR
jgi:hypothetical protein